MAGWHHRFNGYEFEQAPGVGDGQGSLACCSPWDHKESDTTQQLNFCGILQARIVEWVAMPSSKGSSQPRDRTWVSYVSCIRRWVLYH